MRHSNVKLNLVIQEEISKDLRELIPAGNRSKWVNKVLAKELLSIKRKKLTDKLLDLRNYGPLIKTSEIVATLRKFR